MAGACTFGAVVSLFFPEEISRLVEPLPLSRHGNGYWVFVGVMALMAAMCWYITAKYLYTSPEDDARTVADRVAQGKPLPAKFNPALLDASDPAYGLQTWRYALSKWRSRG